MKKRFFVLSLIGLFLVGGLLLTGCSGAKDDGAFYESGGNSSSNKSEPQPYEFVLDTGGYFISKLNFNENEDKSVLRIPDTYKGQPVVGISALTGEDVEGTGQAYSEIKKIIIPKTIKRIGDHAFYGMNHLTAVEFESGSTLNKIDVGTFMNCTSLTEISLPDTVKEIEVEAFRGCTALQSFTVGKNVTWLMVRAFLGCDKLTAFSVAQGNTSFSVKDGVLFNAQGTELLMYPEGKAGNSYTVPATVTEIAAYAFAGNKKLQTLNLNQVSMIRQYGLSECTALATISPGELEYTEIGALEGSKWFTERTEEQVILGRVLLRYQGNAERLEVNNVTSIAPFAFAENKRLKSVILSSYNLNNVGDWAFSGCENLSEVYVNVFNQMVYIGTKVFDGNQEGRKIYVPKGTRTQYRDNELWQTYSEFLEEYQHQTRFCFNSNGGEFCADKIVLQYGPIGSLPTPLKKDYLFSGWYFNSDLSGKQVDTITTWTKMVDKATLYAKWTPQQYFVQLFPENGEDASTVYYTIESDTIELPNPTRTGYTFKGWYDNRGFTGSSITEISKGSTGYEYYYAKWEGTEYTVTLNYGYRGCPASGTSKVTYGQYSLLPVPERETHSFNGWRLPDGTLYTNGKGFAAKPWDIEQDIELTADWSYGSPIDTTKFTIEAGCRIGDQEFLDFLKVKEGGKFRYFTLESGEKFWNWEGLPQLKGQEGICKIYIHFDKEVNFSIDLLGFKIGDFANPPIAKMFGEEIELPTLDKEGYIFDGWYVADNEYNRKDFEGTQFEIGSKFDCKTMPDLSVGREEDGTHIYLEARFIPIEETESDTSNRENNA